MTEDKAIVVKEINPVQKSPVEICGDLVKAGVDPAMISQIMDLQDRHEEKEAKKAFIRAMALFKADPIHIKKDKENKQYNSRYSSIDAVVNACLPRMGELGLSHKWDFEQTDPKVMVGTCTVTHEAGHSDSVSMPAPIDISGKKNPIQQIKSTRTYIKIETFSSLMGLASSEDLSDDGNASVDIEYITEEQQITLKEHLDAIEGDLKEFCKWANVESLDRIQVRYYSQCLNALKAKAE